MLAPMAAALVSAGAGKAGVAVGAQARADQALVLVLPVFSQAYGEPPTTRARRDVSELSPG